MNGEEIEFLDILQNIEFGLKLEYEKNLQLTDTKVIYALENAKLAIKQEYGYGKKEKLVIDDDTEGIINFCVMIGRDRINDTPDLTLRKFTNLIDKIARSVNRHSQYGKRGYYDFIRNYV